MVYRNWGQYDKAVDVFEWSLAIKTDLKDRRGKAQTLNNLGMVYTDWGRYKTAGSYYEEALAIYRDLKDRRGQGRILNNLGMLAAEWGLFVQAVEHYERCLAIKREVKDRRGEASTLNNLGIVFAAWGRYDKAVSYYEKSLEVCRDLKDRSVEGRTLNNLGIVYKDLGQYDKAVSHYEGCLGIFRELKDRIGEGQTLCNLGSVYSGRGMSRAALKEFRAGLAILQEIKVPTQLPKNLIANLYMDEGDFQQARELVEEVGYWYTRGRFYLFRSDYENAKDEYKKHLEIAEKTRDTRYLYVACTGLGLSYEGMKDDEKAADYFRKAVALTEELRTSLAANQRDKFFDVRIGGFLRTVPYEGLARVLMRMQKPNEALKGSEYTKARVFAEGISRQAQGEQFDIPAIVLEEDRKITDQLAALKKQRQKAYEKNNKLAIEALAPQIKELEAELKAHIEMLRQKYPLFAATKYPEPMDLSQTALTDNEWTLSYDVTDSGVLIYLTKGKELVKALFKLIPRKELDGLVRKFREPLEVTEGNFLKKLKSFDFASGKKLSALLLSDVLSYLPEGIPVITVPDDSLGVLPFEMLVLNEGGEVITDKKIPYVTGAKFFGDRNPISYYQSITALTLARTFAEKRKGGKNRLVMDDPVFSADDGRVKRLAACWISN